MCYANTRLYSSIYGTVVMPMLLFLLSGVTLSEEKPKNNILASLELPNIVQNLTKDALFPSTPTYPSREEVEKLDRYISENLAKLEGCWTKLTFSDIRRASLPRDESGMQNTIFSRKDRCEAFLALHKTVRDLIDPKFVAQPAFMNLMPMPDESDDTNQLLLPGMSPKDIQNSKTRENYEEALWNNSKNIFENRIQRAVVGMLPRVQRVFREDVLRDYSRNPHADQELIDLMEQYDYPEADRTKLLADLADYRSRQSAEVLIEPPAGVHELQEGEVLNPDGSISSETITTVRISKEALRIPDKPSPSPPPSPPLYSNRLKIGLTIYAVFITIVFALYFYFRFRWQRSQSAS